jgi:chemotaxis protein MotB
MPLRSTHAALLALPLMAACITTSEHEELMAAANQRLMDAQQRHQAEMSAAQGQIVSLNAELKRLQGEIAARDTRISELQAKLDDGSALNAQLRAELEKTGQDVNKLLSEKGNLSKSLDDTKARLEELRKAQAAAQQRAALYRSLLAKFKKMIDAGDRRMVLQLRNDVLFDSARVSIKDDGKEALTEVASVLATLGERKLQVAGHTDNVPIATQRFASNWELSTARAVNVVKFLIEQGVQAEALSAAGYSEYDPVASNDDDTDRGKNRRIEIVLQPNIAELVQIPQ